MSIWPSSTFEASIAATERARVEAAGDPVIWALGPSLPAEATTSTPARDALSAATASGSVASPNGEPSDRLMTSMPSATAWLMASTTTSVEPSQPKTL